MGAPTEKKSDDWLSMKEKDRVRWVQKGPESGDVREDMYDAIMGTLRALTDG